MKKRGYSAVLLVAAVLGAHASGTGATAGASSNAPAVAAEHTWFTITGDAARPDAETVQVDPVALRTDGDARTMRVRVSRSQERRNWDDVPYRSYESDVVINCRTRRAYYVQASFFRQAVWQGEPHHDADYRKSPQPMLFRGMNPNPTERIIRAACKPTE